MNSHPAPLLYCKDMPDQTVIADWLRGLRRNAYVPGSHYQVAAIIMMRVADGYYFAGGVNVECYEHRLNMHGEESAIAALTTALGKKAQIDGVWVMAAPDHLDGPVQDKMADVHGQTCGNCRQQIANLARHKDISVCAITLNGAPMNVALDVLLPHSFSFSDFDPAIAKRRAKNQSDPSSVEWATLERRIIRREPQTEADIFAWLSQLESLDYASGRGQAVVLTLGNGASVAGVKFENAAYTGQGAMQAAIGIAVTTFGTIKVQSVHSLSCNGNEQDAAFYPLPLSALQSLSEFAASDDLPITLFNRAGDKKTDSFAGSGRYHTRFSNPALSEE